ncbi:D-glycero-beta-D-manno-heptose-7-phosphate kinase, partial [Laribacter hongkongensis]|nr:D-glycero-beta-D-manno-heptose-7-phosphate kinase [Laribacter hongkongensis]
AGFDLPAAMQVANAAAGIVVGKLGTAVVTFTELFGERRAASGDAA